MAKVGKTFLTELIREVLSEEKADRCLRIARTKYDKPSAYRSGAIVRCRKGDIWKDIKETEDPQSGKAAPYGSGLKKVTQAIQELLQEDESLRKQFSRKGAKVKPRDGLIVTHLTEKEDINPAEDKKEKKDQNTQLVDQHPLNVKQKEKVRIGVKQNNYDKNIRHNI